VPAVESFAAGNPPNGTALTLRRNLLFLDLLFTVRWLRAAQFFRFDLGPLRPPSRGTDPFLRPVTNTHRLVFDYLRLIGPYASWLERNGIRPGCVVALAASKPVGTGAKSK